MDLVIICDSANAFGSVCRRVCEVTHKKHIPGIERTHAIFVADKTFESTIVAKAMQETKDRPFVLTYDTTFLRGDWDPMTPKMREGFAHRKGIATDMMVDTLQFLCQGGYDTYDYQLRVPMYVEPAMAKVILSVKRVSRMHFRTLYGNMVHGKAERMSDPHIDPWIHSLDPQGPVVSVGPTALKHKKCRQWIISLDK